MTILGEMQTQENRSASAFYRFVSIKVANKRRRLIYRLENIILSRKPKQAQQCKRPTLISEELSQFQILFNWNFLRVAKRMI